MSADQQNKPPEFNLVTLSNEAVQFAAAHKLGIVRSGYGNVVVERVFPVEGSDRIATKPASMQKPAGGEPYYLQLGAYDRLATAEAELRELLSNDASSYNDKLAIVNQQGLYRVRMGPFSQDSDAIQAALALDVPPVITR